MARPGEEDLKPDTQSVFILKISWPVLILVEVQRVITNFLLSAIDF